MSKVSLYVGLLEESQDSACLWPGHGALNRGKTLIMTTSAHSVKVFKHKILLAV